MLISFHIVPITFKEEESTRALEISMNGISIPLGTKAWLKDEQTWLEIKKKCGTASNSSSAPPFTDNFSPFVNGVGPRILSNENLSGKGHFSDNIRFGASAG